GMMLTVAVALYVGYYAWAVDRTLLGRALGGRGAAFVVASVVVLLPFHFAYFEVQRAWQASWTPGALAGFSADVQSYLAAPPQVNGLYVSLFRPVTPIGAHERLLFPGLLLLVLAVLGLVARVRGVARAGDRGGRGGFGVVVLVYLV